MLEHSKLELEHIPELKTAHTGLAPLGQSLSAVLIVNDNDICHLSAVVTQNSNGVASVVVVFAAVARNKTRYTTSSLLHHLATDDRSIAYTQKSR